jgi:KDO2-lipid IV(A) lauroyltransferase
LRSWLVAALFAGVGRLSLPWALRLGGALGALAFHLAGRSRRLALAHLAIAFPELSEGERLALARRSFIHLGRCALEVAAWRRIDPILDRYVELPPAGERILKEALARGRGLIFVTGHLGNWELLARRISRAGVPNAIIARAGGDRRWNEMAARIRATAGVTTHWREDAGTGRAIIRTLRGGRALGLLIDQDTRVQGVFVPFFGRLAHTPRAAADLALRFEAPVVVCTSRRRGSDPLAGHLLDITEVPNPGPGEDREVAVASLTARCTAILEVAIRRAPEEWVWMHSRWKTRPERAEQVDSLASGMPKSLELSGG